MYISLSTLSVDQCIEALVADSLGGSNCKQTLLQSPKSLVNSLFYFLTILPKDEGGFILYDQTCVSGKSYCVSYAEEQLNFYQVLDSLAFGFWF